MDPDSLYAEPLWYGMLFDERSRDVGFYVDQSDAGEGAVLELGAGTGRVAIPVARRGHAVVAVERSPAMLGALRERLRDEPEPVRARVTAVESDVRDLDLGRAFRLVTSPFNVLAHQLDDEALAAFLGGVRRHLQPGGRFAFDVMRPEPTLLNGGSSEVPWFRDPRTGEVSRSTETVRYDAATATLRIDTEIRSMQADRDPEHLRLTLRVFSPEETPGLLARHGWALAAPKVDLGDSIAWVVSAS